MKKVILTFVVVVAAFLVWDFKYHPAVAPTNSASPSPSASASASPTASAADSITGTSIYNPARVSKKPFGIYVSPGHSPVSPERFSGFHTGTDFETTPAEADVAVPVPAFCDGTLLKKEYASGYGGVAVESCTLGGQAVTVIYGHLNLASITPAVGQDLKKGDFIGNLGKGYSTETDGERKHLHLGIHKATSVNITGYVSSGELNNWLDAQTFLNLPESNDYELHESDLAQTFVYPVTSRVGIVLDSSKYSPTGMDCEPHGVLGSVSNIPAVPTGQFAVRYEGLVAGGCTLQDGSWYAHIIIK